MQIVLWTIVLVAAALIVYCLWRLHQERGRVNDARKSLSKALGKVQHLEEELRGKSDLRETTEQKLRQYLLLLDTLINTMPNPVYFKDHAGVFQGCNRMFARNILGLTRDRIIGRRSQDLPEAIPPDLAARYQRDEMKMVEKRGLHAFEAPVRCADGHQRDFLFSMAPVLDHHAEISGWVAVLADLTEKNHAIWDRLQKEKLQSVLETAGAVCHELNQPLQALSGYIELLTAQTPDDLQVRGYLANIMSQIERVSDITNKLQGITRYEIMEYAGSSKIIDIHKASDA